ncbi:MAG: hypothetical protein P1V51_14955 [Deltaproteobacteria bacterium]|nr:hypothetical protein [Deltaproteobacteria bacterium]
MSPSGGRAVELAGSLAHRLTVLEPSARLAAATAFLELWSVEDMVDALEGLLRLREAGDRHGRDALGVMTEAISALGERDEISDLLVFAREHHRLEVAHLLERPPPAREFRPEDERGVDREMRSKTLGFRKALARKADRPQLARLLTDPDPSVVHNLLAHPRLTETEVVGLAARRPARPEVLREIYRAPRWSTRRRVRRALANNPYTPTEIALKLVALLPLSDAKAIAADGNLHEAVRRAAGARVAEFARRKETAEAAAQLDALEPEGEA